MWRTISVCFGQRRCTRPSEWRWYIPACKIGSTIRECNSESALANWNLYGPAIPCYLVGDETIGLKSYIQRPFPDRSTGNLSIQKKIFNYWLSRPRRVIEKTFGIMATKWRIFRKPIEDKVEKVNQIVKADICQHNFILIQ